MTKQRPNPTKAEVQGYDDPVLFSTSGGNIWHTPAFDGDDAVFLCERDGSATSIRVCEHDFFLRRRNARMCKTCEKRAESHEHAEITVKAND